MKRIIILRHGEEPKQKRVKHIQSEIGLSLQGFVRASLMPELILNLLGRNESFELHTYTHTVTGVPMSRSYYTAQRLFEMPEMTNKILYDKSAETKELVKNIQQSKATNIIVVWEHLKIPLIIQKLIDVEPNYVKISRKIFANLGDKFKVKSKQRVDPQNVTGVTYCAPEFSKENEQVRHYYIRAKANIEYSLAWEIDFDRKSFKVYPTYIIKRYKKGQEYNVIKYL